MSMAPQTPLDLIPIAYNLDGLGWQNLKLDIPLHMSPSSALELLLLSLPKVPRDNLLQLRTQRFALVLLEKLRNI